MFRQKYNRKSCRKLLKNWEFQFLFNISRRPALETEILKSNLFHHPIIFFAFNLSMNLWCSGYDIGLQIQRTRVQISVRPQHFFFFFRWILIFYVSDDIWFDYNNMIRKNMVWVMILLWMRFRWMIKRKKNHSWPGFEPGTVRSLSQRVNHYTKSACLKKLLKSWVFIRKDFQYLSWTPLKIKTENTGWMLMKNPI